METIRITGGHALKGEVVISGAKNAALPIMAATLLTEEPCRLQNIPDLSDIRCMADILRHLGATVVQTEPNTLTITAKGLETPDAPYELVRKMRAAICLMGPLIGRLRRAKVPLPGGCIIGPRPIDLHLKGFSKLGCDIRIEKGNVYIEASHLQGERIFLGGRHGSTVTGTANILMAAVLTPGITCIESAACEPEIQDLCRMLSSMGAHIDGIGTHTLTIEGVDRLDGCTHCVIPDRIEAGTYLIAAAITAGEVTLHGAQQRHLGAIIDKLEQATLPLTILDHETIQIHPRGNPLHPLDLIMLPYPGFPTDLQAQICALMATTPGLSIITDRIYPNRYMHIPELQRMGADIAIEGSSFIIAGGTPFSGTPVMASDLRASAALILAGLVAKGDTLIQQIHHLDRGYEKFEQKLRGVGALIERMPASPSLS